MLKGSISPKTPTHFTKDSVVEQMLTKVGTKCLPLILVDGHIVSQGTYPSRKELTAFTGTATQKAADRQANIVFPCPGTASRTVEEGVAEGAVAADDHNCLDGVS